MITTIGNQYKEAALINEQEINKVVNTLLKDRNKKITEKQKDKIEEIFDQQKENIK